MKKFFDDAKLIGNILLDAIKNISAAARTCHCVELRKETLLKEIYDAD